MFAKLILLVKVKPFGTISKILKLNFSFARVRTRGGGCVHKASLVHLIHHLDSDFKIVM